MAHSGRHLGGRHGPGPEVAGSSVGRLVVSGKTEQWVVPDGDGVVDVVLEGEVGPFAEAEGEPLVGRALAEAELECAGV